MNHLSSFLHVSQRQYTHSLLGPHSRLLKLGRMMTMSDLPEDLLEEILFRIPLTSLSAVRSTCKKWNAFSKNLILGKKATAVRKQFLGFIMMDCRVCSMKFDLQGIPNDADFVDPSIKQVDILNQVEISKVFHCDGLLLCITKDNSRLVVWNPYLGETRWIQPRDNIHKSDMYALGYDNNRNHKILRIFGDPKRIYHDFGYETYNFSSNSWKVYNATPLWDLKCHQRGVSLNGNTYFLANQKRDSKDIVVCFDFTTERFGPRLPLPYHFRGQECFESLACVREEKLAVLHQSWGIEEVTEIWVANKIDPGAVSWSKFLRSTSGCKVHILGGSFFIDEEKKVAAIFDLDVFMPTGRRSCNQTAHIFGQDGYFKPVNIGKAPNLGEFDRFGIYHPNFCRPLVCSSYVPSLVQLQSNEASIREESDD